MNQPIWKHIHNFFNKKLPINRINSEVCCTEVDKSIAVTSKRFALFWCANPGSKPSWLNRMPYDLWMRLRWLNPICDKFSNTIYRVSLNGKCWLSVEHSLISYPNQRAIVLILRIIPEAFVLIGYWIILHPKVVVWARLINLTKKNITMK